MPSHLHVPPTPLRPDPLSGSLRDYQPSDGTAISAAARRFRAWLESRVAFGGFPYSKNLVRAPAPQTTVRLADGSTASGLNFGSQDYLNLASHPAVRNAAFAALGRYGLHSGGAAVLAGAIDLAEELESALAAHLHLSAALLCPTGWAAGYGAVRGLVRENDHVVIDHLAHNCLQEGAAAATRNVHVFRHLDAAHARLKLAAIRAKHPASNILVVTEGLFSMDADSPDLAAFHALCRGFDALLLVDVAHDLGSTGPNGTGQIGAQSMLGKIDVVVGSFSKTFATNGGFIATRERELCDYLRYFSPATTFSSALAPAQIAAALAALHIVRSDEGARRRAALLHAAQVLRSGFACRNVEVLGQPSPLVPVFVGRDDVARVAARSLTHAGVLTNLIEYPAVSRATARFRLQAMSEHHEADCQTAALRISEAIAQAREFCARRSSVAA